MNYLFKNASALYPPDLQAQIGDANQALRSRSLAYFAVLKEKNASTQVYKDAYTDMTGCGDKPIKVLSASQTTTPLALDSPAAKASSPDMLAFTNLVLRWQGEENVKMAACSMQGERLVMDSSHYMTFDQPGAVVSAIRQVVENVEKGQ